MRRKSWLSALAALLLVLSIPVSAYALGAPYRPPTLTLVVTGAPEDLSITIDILRQEEQEHVLVKLEKSSRAWESYFRLYREAAWRINAWYGNAYDLQGAELILESGGQTRRISIPQELLTERGDRDVLCLHFRSGSLKPVSPWRAISLTAMRALCLLLAESLIFLAYGYRERRSWLIFLLINLATILPLSIWVPGRINVDPNFIIIYGLIYIVALVAEILALLIVIDEDSRDRTISFAFTANAVSTVLNVVMLSYLPS